MLLLFLFLLLLAVYQLKVNCLIVCAFSQNQLLVHYCYSINSAKLYLRANVRVTECFEFRRQRCWGNDADMSKLLLIVLAVVVVVVISVLEISSVISYMTLIGCRIELGAL